MDSITNPPERVKLLKAVRKNFTANGWSVEENISALFDFTVSSNSLKFSIKCLDSTLTKFKGSSSIITSLDEDTQYLRRSLNRVSFYVLDKNFLSTSLESLLDRGIFVLLEQDLAPISALSSVSGSIPRNVNNRQLFVLKRCLDYAVFVSNKYRASGHLDLAVEWGRYALENSSGITTAHMNLFNLYMAKGDLDAADEIGKILVEFRGNDPRVMRSMRDLALKRGDVDQVLKCDNLLRNGNLIPRTLDDILDKQRHNTTIAIPKVNDTPVISRLNTRIMRVARAIFTRWA